MSLLVIGSLAFDDVETPFAKQQNILAGSGTFISISAGFFAENIQLVGVVGEDFGEKNLNLYRERGIDISGVQVVAGGKTFRWSGRYHYDMNSRDTLDTQLNVLADFNPVIPHAYQQAKFVCLGNIDPVLQKNVLGQISRPKLVVCDTMNFWIEGKPKELQETLALVDALIINDSEARQLSKDPNLIKSARIIRAMGPKILIIKKGEHGALLFTDSGIFSAPAYPLETVFDPTGAGDCFAGGFIGYLAKAGEVNDQTLRRAVLYGSTMASFCVEKFGVERLLDLTPLEVGDRFQSFLDLSKIDD
ncbi:MAG: sugar kinase [[Candidatus Thermochlorobacteriaceae] bacterium GBChlB]|nr:MAG: sugar kinase [[Candidatus Thermochlorobacteriaceae] bacterium GBChlB]